MTKFNQALKSGKLVLDPNAAELIDAVFNDIATVQPEVVSIDDRLDRVKKKLEPFLNNLMLNPKQDIHWPDRDKKIKAFKKELWDIIDGKTTKT